MGRGGEGVEGGEGGDGEMGGTRGQGDKETRGQGDKGNFKFSTGDLTPNSQLRWY